MWYWCLQEMGELPVVTNKTGFMWKMYKLTSSKMWSICKIWESKSLLDDLSHQGSPRCCGNQLLKSSASKHFRQLHSWGLLYSPINQQNCNSINFGFICVTSWEMSWGKENITQGWTWESESNHFKAAPNLFITFWSNFSLKVHLSLVTQFYCVTSALCWLQAAIIPVWTSGSC